MNWKIQIVLALGLFTVFNVMAVEVKVDPDKKYQVIHGFGTCMKSWGSPDKCPVVKWQQSSESAKLYADELRFNMLRIPINKWVLGGPNPYGIPSPDVEPLKKDPELISWKNFLWERNEGRSQDVPGCQIDWVKAMLKLNPDIKVFGSVWSPPAWMKEKATGTAGKKFNWAKYGSASCGGRLAPEYYEHYAKYLAEWSKGLKEKYNIDLYAVSVQNELLFYEPYDSCVYDYSDFAPVVRAIGRRFKKEGITTKIIGPEDMTKFAERTARYLAQFKDDPELQSYLPVVCSHGYADGIETNLEAGDAAKLWNIAKKYVPEAEYWMTETGGGGGLWKDFETTWTTGKKKGQKRIVSGALTGFATMLHNALVSGNASVWTTWQFLDTSEGCRAGLVQATMEKMIPTKKFYVQKHFSRWTPAGCRRIEASVNGEKLLACAFLDEPANGLTIIMQNHEEKAQEITLDTGGINGTFELYVTDEARDCVNMPDVTVENGKAVFELPARSIVTLTNVKLKSLE